MAALTPSSTQERTLAWIRMLEPVNPAEMIGLWKGSGHPSGHPLDGVLENLGWFGKRFHTDLRADALLFERAPGKLIAIEQGRRTYNRRNGLRSASNCRRLPSIEGWPGNRKNDC